MLRDTPEVENQVHGIGRAEVDHWACCAMKSFELVELGGEALIFHPQGIELGGAVGSMGLPNTRAGHQNQGDRDGGESRPKRCLTTTGA